MGGKMVRTIIRASSCAVHKDEFPDVFFDSNMFGSIPRYFYPDKDEVYLITSPGLSEEYFHPNK
jgi:hypothetical protein